MWNHRINMVQWNQVTQKTASDMHSIKCWYNATRQQRMRKSRSSVTTLCHCLAGMWTLQNLSYKTHYQIYRTRRSNPGRSRFHLIEEEQWPSLAGLLMQKQINIHDRLCKFIACWAIFQRHQENDTEKILNLDCSCVWKTYRYRKWRTVDSSPEVGPTLPTWCTWQDMWLPEYGDRITTSGRDTGQRETTMISYLSNSFKHPNSEEVICT